VLALGALLLAAYAGKHWGWPGVLIALPVGFFGLLGLLYVVFLALLHLERGWLPECESGRCRGDAATGTGDYDIVPDEDEWFYRCPCGHEYVKVGRRFMRRLPDGTLEPYMIWKLFRGFVHDTDPR